VFRVSWGIEWNWGRTEGALANAHFVQSCKTYFFFEKELFLKSIKMSYEKLKICNQSIGSRCEKIKYPTDRDPPNFS
jgi:hypothetical protein